MLKNIKSSIFRFCILSTFVLASHVSASAQSLCDITITLASDTLTYQDTYICLPLKVENFQNVSELELSITIPDRDIIFRDGQMLHPSLSDIKISASNYAGKSIVQLFWTADGGSTVSIEDEELIGELCFDIIDYPHEGFELNFEGLGLQQGNSIFKDDKSKLICVKPGRIESPCSAQKFRIHEDANFRNTDRCRNDCNGIRYPNHKHPESDLPLTVKVYNDGILIWDRIIRTNDRMEGWMDTCFYSGLIEVFVWNADGCMDSTSFNSLPILESKENDSRTLGWGAPEIQHTCQGTGGGSIFVWPITESGDTVHWDNGEVQVFWDLMTFSRENLEPGIYSGYQELKDCRATAYFEVLNIPTYEISHNTRFATCDGSDGSIWIETDPSGNYKYSWEGKLDTTAIIENLTPGTYQVTVTNPEGCEVERSIELPMTGYIQLEWESEVSFPDCLPGTKASRTISLNSNNITGVDFIWSSGEMSIGTSATATQLGSGQQWVYAYTATCASDTMFFEVGINEEFDVSIDHERNDLLACPGTMEFVYLNYDSTANPRFFDRFGVELTHPLSLPIGSHTITAASESGCSQNIEIEITSAEYQTGTDFIIDGAIPDLLCPGEELSLSIVFEGEQIDVFALLNGEELHEEDSISLIIGEYNLSLTNQQGCMWDTTFIIGERELEIVVPEDLSITEGQAIILTTSHDDTGSLEYDWQATNTWSCNVEDCRSIIYNPLVSETIYLDVRNEFGCSYEDSIVVTVIDTMEVDTLVALNPPSDDDFYIPNIISQGSSLNNEFCVVLTDVIQSVDFFALYDRWGNQVALNSNSNSARSVCLTESLIFQSQQLSSGVYVYVIQFAYVDGRTVRRSGNVTIL